MKHKIMIQRLNVLSNRVSQGVISLFSMGLKSVRCLSSSQHVKTLLIMSLFLVLSVVHIEWKHNSNNRELMVSPTLQGALAKKSKGKRKRKKSYDRRRREAKRLIDAGHPTVELNLKTSPRVRASVYHGKELLGKTPLRLVWPKDTGALDLKLKAGGYLTVNTRLYTYRNDRATVKMFKIDEAHKLFGYKKKVDSAESEDKKEE
mgnify:CR=1 FL=1